MSRALPTSVIAMTSKQVVDLLAISIPAKMQVLLTGPPAIGKTQIMRQACKRAGVKLIISHPVVSEAIDYKGMPHYKDGADLAEFIPFADLHKLMTATEPTVFFLDDLGQALPSVQAAAMQLLGSREINGKKISDHIIFMAATNRKADKAGVSGILEPVKSRFKTIIEMKVDVPAWCQWAIGAGLPIELVAFINFRPNLLHEFVPTIDMTNSPSPRTVEAVGEWMKLNLPTELQYPTYAGAVGEGFTGELLGFLKIWKSLPNPDAVLLNPDTADVPMDVATLLALCGSLAKKATQSNIGRILTYGDRFHTDEYRAFLVQACNRENPDVANTTEMITWHTNNSGLLV